MKVYISSPYTDLRDHRAAVALTLRRMGHDVIGMEEYVAEAMTPLDKSLADVRSADVYVIILGWRYGYVPPDVLANPEGRSITELEFEQATRAGKSILAFLSDPDAAWPVSAMDAFSVGGAAAILRFRSLLGANYLAGLFTTPDNLASQAAAAVAAQGVNRHMVERALKQTEVTGGMVAFVRGEPLFDTTESSIREMVSHAGVTRALVLNIGEGDVWWSTRLYLLAGLCQSLTGIRQFVFTGVNGEFAGMASPASVRDGISAAFPRLKSFDALLREGPASQDLERELGRWLNLWKTQITVEEQDLKVGVRWPLLVEWLGERLVTRCIELDSEAGPTMAQVQQLVGSLLPDVPVQQRAPPLPEILPAPPQPPPGVPAPAASPLQLMVVDRDAFALELAREWVQSGVPRSAIR